MKLTSDPHFVRSITQPYTIWNNCFTDEQLNSMVEFHDQLGVTQSYVGDESSVDQNVRKSSSSFHYKTDQNSWIFDRILHMIELTNDMFFQFDLLGFEKYQYTVYNKEDYYDYHVDTVYGSAAINKENHLTRKLSLSILLNDPNEFQGGNIELCYGKFEEALSFKLNKGTAIFFPSAS